ncbi:MAG TPA: DUF47 family protein [Candidatus Butyricicoccus stercorigallinarum]|nr:DUF47 family protein [Candidatus Butyricicoccus stercorigallinarum]
MSKKQDAFYFDTFAACSAYSCQAAQLLAETMEHFDAGTVSQRLDEIHAIEHEADKQKHVLVNTLAKAFVTPIEREDILMLGQNIDEVTDKLEDVLIRIYYSRIQSIPPEAVDLVRIVCRCCEEVHEMLLEFSNFKRSKKLHSYVVKINTMEEEADRAFIANMYQLHGSGRDALEIIALREIYLYLEKCADACEHVADVVESVIMKNS